MFSVNFAYIVCHPVAGLPTEEVVVSGPSCVELEGVGQVAPTVAVADLRLRLEHRGRLEVADVEAEGGAARGGWRAEPSLQPGADLLVGVVDL